MTIYLPSPEMLPAGFRFPENFIEAASLGQAPSPWWYFCKYEGWSEKWLEVVREWYPLRSLIPFAGMDQTDDLACFDGSDRTGNPAVFYVHSFAEFPYEDRGQVANFAEWLIAAESDSKADIDG